MTGAGWCIDSRILSHRETRASTHCVSDAPWVLRIKSLPLFTKTAAFSLDRFLILPSAVKANHLRRAQSFNHPSSGVRSL